MGMDEETLKILACPWCVTRPDRPPEGVRKGEMELVGDRDNPEALRCKQCGRSYRIQDGIPHLLLEEAVLADEKAQS